LGGGSGAGKSTIACRLAAQHGLRMYATEGFGLIIEDLLRLPAESGAIAEGFRLLPRLVKPLLATPHHAVWLLPTPEFRRAAFASRGSLWEIARKTSDPEKALQNLLERDRMFTDRLVTCRIW
jgi:2-phosphoglycerate kinase